MTSKNGRRIMALSVLALILLPTEVLVITTLRDGPRSVEDLWSKRLDNESRAAAVLRLQEYPIAYRHALLRSLSEPERIAAWQRVAQSYLARRSDLTESQKHLLNRVLAAEAGARTLGDVPAGADLLSAEEAVLAELGQSAYRYLFVDAGPPSTGPAYRYSVLPLRSRVEAFIRAQVLRAEYDCNCRMGLSMDCDATQVCLSDTNCRSTVTGCGINQGSSCDGVCKTIEDK